MSKKQAKQDKQESGWQLFLDMLTPAARSAIQHKEPAKLPTPVEHKVPTDENDQFAAFRSSLMPSTRERVDGLVSDERIEPVDIEPDTNAARYCLVEGPDGEWSSVRVFKTPEGLARRIGSMEGQDMVVWAFFGIPLRITKGPQRYLLLPDGQQAITIPLYDGGPVQFVDADLLSEREIQEDGFVGRPELAVGRMPEPKMPSKKMAPGKVTKTKDDDDDDEEDEDATA